jgi:hypothetical protein
MHSLFSCPARPKVINRAARQSDVTVAPKTNHTETHYARVPGASENFRNAGIEPASASPPRRGLHAYSVFTLITGYPTGREKL